MKFFQIFLVVLVFLVNLVVAQPSFAGSKFSKNPDYIEIVQELDNLLEAQEAKNITADEKQKIQQQIDKLEFDKYNLQTGINWGQCSNETGKSLGIYGRKTKKYKSDYDNALYFLANGQTTEEQWDCEGVYLPGDVKIAGFHTTDEQGQASTSPVAIKIVDGTHLVVKTNPETSEIEFNLPGFKVFKPGEINWFIPNVSQADIDSHIPNVPTPSNDD